MMAAPVRNAAPDLMAALSAPARGVRLEAPELVDAIAAILDRLDVAGPDERARLGRVAGQLERELAERLAE
jgi:hypothetical protein